MESADQSPTRRRGEACFVRGFFVVERVGFLVKEVVYPVKKEIGRKRQPKSPTEGECYLHKRELRKVIREARQAEKIRAGKIDPKSWPTCLEERSLAK